MAVYSHSKLGTFEQCKFKYKLRYVDKIKPLLGKNIEGFLGECVHKTLEWLYGVMKDKSAKMPQLDDVILYYSEFWRDNWQKDIRVVKQTRTTEDYFNFGIKFLIDYYQKFKPFDQNVLALEKKIEIDILKDGKYSIVGYIDRLDFNEETNSYEIHDYKTAGSLKTQEELEADRQLALYSLAIREEFGVDKDICLIWHYLDFDKDFCLNKTEAQLQKLREDIVKLIDGIEKCEAFPTEPSVLCNWCEYRAQCPLYEYEYKKEELQRNLVDLNKDAPEIKKEIKVLENDVKKNCDDPCEKEIEEKRRKMIERGMI